MLLGFSVLGFALGFGLFVYFFDHFMGASDTADLADVMSGIQHQNPPTATKKNKKLSAATGR
ncbi:MAG: hypothetical protein ACJ71Q_01635 [Terriglobales bacterium]